MRTIGIIGIGSMGGAIARGLLETGELRPEEVALCDREMDRLEPFATRWPALACYDQPDLMAEECGMIILAVKPYVLAGVVEACGESLEDKAVISIAAGWTVPMLRHLLERTGARWLRVMPNTPAMVGEGMTALCEDTSFTQKELGLALRVFNALGRTVTLPERLFDGVTALSGSSPAYIYMLIEAMIDAGIREGIPAPAARELAAQSVLGTALMVLSSDKHPAELRTAVCSPGGTTIDAVAVLEEKGFRHAVQEAVRVCAEKSRRMSEQNQH